MIYFTPQIGLPCALNLLHILGIVNDYTWNGPQGETAFFRGYYSFLPVTCREKITLQGQLQGSPVVKEASSHAVEGKD